MPKIIPEEYKFGISIILPECSFTAELHKDTIPEMMKDIDDKLTESGAPDEDDTRSAMMMDNALMLSHMIAQRELERGSGVADIAYSIVYAYGKTIGEEKINNLRGITGSYLRNIVNLNPCLNEMDYQQQTTYLSKKMAEHEENNDDGFWDIDLSILPTYH
jgi:hypothetical protein